MATNKPDEFYLAFLGMLAINIPGRYRGDVPVLVIGFGGARDTAFPPSSQRATADACTANMIIN